MNELKTIKIKYFAALKEQATIDEEELETRAKTAEDIFHFLKEKYSFSLTKEQIKVAINDQFEPFDYLLKDGDTLVLIPPVAGG